MRNTLAAVAKRGSSLQKIIKKDNEKLELKDFFTKDLSKSQRDIQMQKAIKDNFTQSKVAIFLGFSTSGVLWILKKSKIKPDPFLAYF